MDSLLAGLKESYSVNTLICFGGFFVGLLFGWLAEASRFCCRAAVAEWTLNDQSARPFRTVEYLAAMVASILVVQLLMASTPIDFDQSIYRSTPFRPVAFLVGGLLFGIGMVLSGGCVSRMLILAASGNLRSWFTLIMIGLGGYATLRGILSYPRVALEEAWSLDGPQKTLDGLMGLSPIFAALIVGAPLLLAIFVFVRRTGLYSLLPGLGIGLLVGIGWWMTGVLGADDFEPAALASLTYTLPVGEALQYLMTFTGDKLRFGVAVIGGVMLGALVSALLSGRYKVIGFQSNAAPLRYGAGGLLMGFGGVTALGCPMGQGITGTGTLSTGSFLVIVSIVVSAGLMYRFFPPKA